MFIARMTIVVSSAVSAVGGMYVCESSVPLAVVVVEFLLWV